MIPAQEFKKKERNLYSTPEPIKFQLITFISKKKNPQFQKGAEADRNFLPTETLAHTSAAL